MASLNKETLIGRLTRDTEEAGGGSVVKFSVATSESWKDKKGEKQEKTEYHRIVTFGKLAEICGKYLRKGSQVYIEGRLQTSSWEKDGVTKYSTDIIASEMKMLGSKAESSNVASEELPETNREAEVPF